jgi:hypothetical protein
MSCWTCSQVTVHVYAYACVYIYVQQKEGNMSVLGRVNSLHLFGNCSNFSHCYLICTLQQMLYLSFKNSEITFHTFPFFAFQQAADKEKI